MPIGVTTKKNITPIISGEKILPNNMPNLNQMLFKGVSTLELKSPKIKKIKETIKDHTLVFSLFNNGYKDIIRNIEANIMPKLLFELLFFIECILIMYIYFNIYNHK